MKLFLAFGLFLTIQLHLMASTYTNPVIDEELADPCLYRKGDVFYLFATGDSQTYRYYTSKDLVNWQKGAVAYEPGLSNLWAPDIYYHPEEQAFYIYDSADFTVGVARSRSVEGPYNRVKELRERAIDAHLFRDDDGQLYLYYTVLPSFTIHVQEMQDPLTPKGDPRPVLRPEEPWETNGNRITEAPFLIKHDGTYYLTYSGSGANNPNYAIGYATSDSPLGPFEKYIHNPVMSRGDGIYGPGHNAIIHLPSGEIWMVYHQKLSNAIAYDRRICVDRITFDSNGILNVTATRGTPQPAPVIEAPCGDR